MLQQGKNIADVAYFIGEDVPKMTGVTDPSLPKGYQFDFINAEVIERDMFVKDGLLTLPHAQNAVLTTFDSIDQIVLNLFWNQCFRQSGHFACK